MPQATATVGTSRLKPAVLLHLNSCPCLSKDGGKLKSTKVTLEKDASAAQLIPIGYKFFLYGTTLLFTTATLLKAGELPLAAFAYLPKVLGLQLGIVAAFAFALWLNEKTKGTLFNLSFGWENGRPHITRK